MQCRCQKDKRKAKNMINEADSGELHEESGVRQCQ